VIIDTHCHPYLPPLDADPVAVLARARVAGVTAFVVPAYDPASWDAVAALASEHADVFPAYGVHPWVADADFAMGELRSRLRNAVAVGEIGLDFKIDAPDRDVQRRVFRVQLALAVELGLPVILHNRGAFEEMIEDLTAAGPVRGVLHAFSRGPEMMRRFTALGLHLGFGGAITFPNAKNPRRSAELAPAERLLLETDAPSIGLQGIPSGESEPRNVRRVCYALAHLRGLNIAETAQLTSRNARALFRLP
jgi:TatD DNase family protein